MQDMTPAPSKAGMQSFFESLRSFHRSQTDRQLGGICGGLAEITPIPAWVYRVLFVLFLLLPITQTAIAAIYYILCICVPNEQNNNSEDEGTPIWGWNIYGAALLLSVLLIGIAVYFHLHSPA